jgi:hypothetical protein
MLDPSIADRVRELVGQGVPSGDAIGQAVWERDHANDPNPWWDEDQDEEYDRG